MKSRFALLGLLIATSAGLSAAGFQPPAGIEVLLNQVYRPGNPRWQLDVARPIDRKAPLPAVLVIHGGGWSEGDKAGEHSVMLRLAQAGYVGVSIGYRLTGEAPFPACVDDCVSALRWVRANAVKLGVDPARIGAYGHSAGGHLVCMLGLAEPAGKFAPGYLEEFAGPVNAVCASSAPTDFPDWASDGGEARGAKLLFGDVSPQELQRVLQRASPLSYVTAEAPPFLFLHGSGDHTVPPAQSERLLAALRKVGAPLAERIVFDGLPHDYVLSHESLYWSEIVVFFDETIGPRSGQLRGEIRTGAEFRKLHGRPEVMAWLAHFDTNHDGFVSRSEFPGNDRLFERLGGLRTGAIPLRPDNRPPAE